MVKEKESLIHPPFPIYLHSLNTSILLTSRGVTIYRGTILRYHLFFYNMHRRVMAIFLQYDVRLILLVELPVRDLLCMRAFTAFTEIA